MSDSGPGRREVAYRLFAAEFDDAEFSYSESDEERAPNYVVTPTGARVNRLFAVGVLTEVDDVNPEMVRGRIVDPTGAFVSYAGQYQPEALAFLERAEPPTFVALSGKARTFEPDDGDQIYTSVRPESISEVDAETRDRWVVTTAERTIDRIGIMASAIEAELSGDQLRAALVEEGIDERLADGVALALDYYDTTPAYLDALRETALDAARVVAGEREEVRSLDVAPDEGMGDASDLATIDLSGAPSPSTAAAAAGVDEAGEAQAAGEATGEPEAESEAEPEPIEESAEAESEPSAESAEPEAEEEPAELEAAETAAEAESVAEPAVESEPETEPESEPETESVETTAEPEASGPAEEPGEFEADEEVREEVEEELDDFEPGEFDLDEETREQVEEEYGTEFSTADEVEEADIETPEPETDLEEGGPESEPEGDEEPAEAEPVEAEGEEEAAEEEGAAEEAEPAGEVDLEDAVMETMEELDEGDGADHDELVDTIVESHGVAAEEVEEAIQDALMSGRCYEPSDGTLKSI
ncbi:MAG: RPA family protein [Natronomonas sp.]|jgi:RPA family protein